MPRFPETSVSFLCRTLTRFQHDVMLGTILKAQDESQKSVKPATPISIMDDADMFASRFAITSINLAFPF